jgi:hypothetical protein
VKCYQCSKAHKDSLDSMALTTPTGVMMFCDYVCLRAWMRMPPPLTEGIPDPRRPGLSPQDVVVGYLKKIADASERYRNLDLATIILGVLAGNLDR